MGSHALGLTDGPTLRLVGFDGGGPAPPGPSLELRKIEALERIAAAMEAGAVTPETPLRIAGGEAEAEAVWLARMEAWLAEATASGVKSVPGRRKVLDRFLRRVGGDLSRESVVQWSIARGREVLPSTFGLERRLVRMFCQWAIQEGHLGADPTARIKAPRIPREIGSRAADPAEALALIAATREHVMRTRYKGSPRQLVYALMYGAGLRAGEARQLRWADFEPGTVRLRPETTKNGEGADQPLPPWLEAMVAETAADPRWADAEYPMAKKIHSGTFRVDCGEKRAKLTIEKRGRRLTVHGLRKAYVTALAASGCPQALISKLARHRQADLTLNVYTDGGALDLGRWAGNLPGPEDFSEESDAEGELSQLHETGGLRADTTGGRGAVGRIGATFPLDDGGKMGDTDCDVRSSPMAATLQSSERACGGRPGSSVRQTEPRAGSPLRALSLSEGEPCGQAERCDRDGGLHDGVDFPRALQERQPAGLRRADRRPLGPRGACVSGLRPPQGAADGDSRAGDYDNLNSAPLCAETVTTYLQ
jgi:integrase